MNPLHKRLLWCLFGVLVVAVGAYTSLSVYLVLRNPMVLTAAGLIDLNRADASDLISLPEIDAVLAKRIVDERRERGDYCSAQDVEDRVAGVGDTRRLVLEKFCVFVKRCPTGGGE